jgi:pyruvate dehydrogenase E2 component (dihydrolipoamide acetyltransferase)
MPVPITMPKFGMMMAEGTIGRWLAVEGDHIEKDQVLVEIETDKAVNQLTSPASGTLSGIITEEGGTASVAETIGWVLLEGESPQDIPGTSRDGVEETEPSVLEQDNMAPRSAVANPPSKPTRIIVSPVARRLAKELGVDLATVTGTGPNGRITKENVLQVTQRQTALTDSSPLSEMVPLSPMRQAIVRHVMRSAVIPQVVLYSHADASALLKVRQRDKTLALDDMIAWCVARTLVDHRYLNASFENVGIRLHRQVNIGIAVAVDQGLIIPVIHDCARLSVSQISAERNRLVERVHSRRINEDDTREGTFTLTNLGMYPVDRFEALLSPPQAAILSIGRIHTMAFPVGEGGVGFQPVIEFGLTLDHRVVDGAAGAAFLRDFINRIETITLEGG